MCDTMNVDKTAAVKTTEMIRTSSECNESMNTDMASCVINKCIECGLDLGASNPRQLCGKRRCKNQLICDV